MINWLQNLSIRRKLMLIIMTTSAVVLMVASAAFVFADRLANQKKLVYLVTSQADLVGANTTAALAFRDNIAANETLSSLREQDHILEAVLYDRDGEEFAKYSNDTADNVRKLKSVIADVRFDGNLLHLTQPVFLENEQIGSIALVADVNRLHARMGDITGLVFLVLIGALIAALLISMRIHRSISVPVTELANVAQRISDDQDYSIRARKLTDDELGNLVDGVNNMLTQIQKRDQMLARHTETLEKKVQERTSELRQLTEQFKHRAYHDELTGLPNRALFEDRLSHALDVAKRHQQRLAVMFLDLDRFKIINDTLGHAAGDKLLCHVASTLTHCLRAEDTVARLGGDEFTVLLQNVENTELAGKTARKIIKTIQQPVEIDGHELHISTSIGIAMYPDDEKDTVGLMRCADAAMYLSKEGGRNRYHFYTDSMHQNAMKRMRLEAELHRAISGNNLTLVYFPRRDLISNQVTGVEALLRWDHPEFGQILPQEFIQVAEESGLMIELGNWVIDRALSQLQEWDQMDIHVPRLSINISGHQLVKPGMAQDVLETLKRHNIKPQRIEFEFGEKALENDAGHIEATLQELSDLGIKLAIDNFGTESGSLNHLRHLPIDIVKIPKEFIHHVSDEDERSVIINAIVLLAHGLDILVIAKGVESKPELECLMKAGCDEVQGFLLNRPVPPDRIPDLIGSSAIVKLA